MQFAHERKDSKLKLKLNYILISAGGTLLRRMSLTTRKVHEATVAAEAPGVLLCAFANDSMLQDPTVLVGIMGALSLYVARDDPPRKTKAKVPKLSPMLHALVGEDGEGLGRIIEHCADAHRKHVLALVRALELISVLLVMYGGFVLEAAKWLRGRLINLVAGVLAQHPGSDRVLAAGRV